MSKQIAPNGGNKIAIIIMAIIIIIGGLYYAFDYRKQKQTEDNKKTETMLNQAYNVGVSQSIKQVYNLSDGCQIVTINIGTSTPSKQLIDTSCITEKQIIIPPEPEEEEEDN